MFNLYLLRGLLMFGTCSANASPFSDPIYTISEEKGILKVNVKTSSGTPEQINESMQKEAKKSSLLGMAYVHHLAKENHPTAQRIAAIYAGYREFFVERNTEKFIDVCIRILKDDQADELAEGAASYVWQVLKHEPISKSPGEKLIKNLIPSIKQTITSNPPVKVYQEQEVRVPEMNGSHNAFPDLIKYKGFYYASFREGVTHGSHGDFGNIRILKGNYNEKTQKWNWENAALLSSETYDFRDPKFFIDANGQLRLIFDGSIIGPEETTDLMVPHVAYQVDGDWKIEEVKIDPEMKCEKGQWIWRITWNPKDNCGYGFSYSIDSPEKGAVLTLVKTTDGISFEKVADISVDEPKENLSEATIRFKEDGTAVALIRSQRHGLIGTASKDSNYTNWSFAVIPFRVGGPNFLITDGDLKMWAATRHFFVNSDNTLDETTIVASMNTKRLVPLLYLKSYGDGSYPGMVMEEDGSITILYYFSTEDEKCNIYVTRVKVFVQNQARNVVPKREIAFHHEVLLKFLLDEGHLS